METFTPGTKSSPDFSPGSLYCSWHPSSGLTRVPASPDSQPCGLPTIPQHAGHLGAVSAGPEATDLPWRHPR